MMNVSIYIQTTVDIVQMVWGQHDNAFEIQTDNNWIDGSLSDNISNVVIGVKITMCQHALI